MRRKSIPVLKLAFLLGCLPILLPGQQNPGVIRPPALGFVFDSGVLRSVLGVPGAAVFGAPVDTGLQPLDAVISPRQDYALLLTGDHRDVTLLRLAAGQIAAAPLAGAMTAPDVMALSPMGNSAVLYRAGDGLLQILTALPDAPRVLRELSIMTLDGTIASAAVADDGKLVLAEVGNNVVVIPADGMSRPLPFDAPMPLMAFLPRAQDAIIASRQTNQVSLILHPADVPQAQMLAGPDDGILKPVAVAFSLDGGRAFIANSGGGLVQLDLSGLPPQVFSCDCKISGLHRLAGNSVFRLTDPSAGPMMVFDGDAPQPRVVFVPPNLESKNSSPEVR